MPKFNISFADTNLTTLTKVFCALDESDRQDLINTQNKQLKEKVNKINKVLVSLPKIDELATDEASEQKNQSVKANWNDDKDIPKILKGLLDHKPKLKSDEKFMLSLVKLYGLALVEFADKKLQGNKLLAWEAVKQNPKVILKLNINIENNKWLLLEAIKGNNWILTDTLFTQYKADPKISLFAGKIEQNERVKAINTYYKNNPEVIKGSPLETVYTKNAKPTFFSQTSLDPEDKTADSAKPSSNS